MQEVKFEEKAKNKGVLKNEVKIGEIAKDANFYVGLILTEKEEANGQGKQTSFVVSKCEYRDQNVDNNSVVLKDYVALEAVNVWAGSKFEEDYDIFYELAFKNKQGKVSSMFVDTFNNIVAPCGASYHNQFEKKVFINALEIRVNGETWVDSIDYYIDLYGEFGTVYSSIFNINGEDGVVVDKYKYKLL